jgi:hypothetical protein
MAKGKAVWARYEKRAAKSSPKVAASKKKGMALGWTLNRLQGGSKDATAKRLEKLYTSGKVSLREYTSISGRIARSGSGAVRSAKKK